MVVVCRGCSFTADTLAGGAEAGNLASDEASKKLPIEAVGDPEARVGEVAVGAMSPDVAEPAFELAGLVAHAPERLPVVALVEKGRVLQAIIEAGRWENVSLVVMGISKGEIVDQWIRAEALHNSELPVVVIPHAITSP